eukprot:7079563-Pyramimonas_sp.AAC.1
MAQYCLDTAREASKMTFDPQDDLRTGKHRPYFFVLRRVQDCPRGFPNRPETGPEENPQPAQK